MRNRYEKDLNRLHSDLISLAEMCITSVDQALKALNDKDENLPDLVINREKDINDLSKKVEQECTLLILRQQPVASDLRFISAALAMNTDLERIGDQARDISVLVKQMLNSGYKKRDLGSLIDMATKVNFMTEEAVKAYIEGDTDLAAKCVMMDDQVDELFLKVRDEVINDIKQESLEAGTLIDILMLAKYLERIGDHATNLGESVLYSLTGKRIKEQDLKENNL